MLDGPAGAPHPRQRSVRRRSRWRRPTAGRSSPGLRATRQRLRQPARREGIELRRVEDGFIRSAGLGASFVQPSSLVFDGRGIFYDFARAERSRGHAGGGGVSARACRARAAAARKARRGADDEIQCRRARARSAIDAGGRPIVLVPGQVEDDASIQRGSPLAAAQHRSPAGGARAPSGRLHRLQAASRRGGRLPPRPRAGERGARTTPTGSSPTPRSSL